MAGEPQTDVKILVIPCDGALETTPTLTEVCCLGVPDGVNYQLELLSVGVTAVTAPAHAANAAIVDIEWVNDSAADAVTDLKASFNLKTITVRVNNEIWRGSQMLDAGDTVNAEFAVAAATLTTASEGAALIVEYRVVRRS